MNKFRVYDKLRKEYLSGGQVFIAIQQLFILVEEYMSIIEIKNPNQKKIQLELWEERVKRVFPYEKNVLTVSLREIAEADQRAWRPIDPEGWADRLLFLGEGLINEKRKRRRTYPRGPRRQQNSCRLASMD